MMRQLFAFASFLCFFLNASAQTTFYVDSGRTNSGAGTSWNTAYKELRDAIAAANGQPGAVQILVARGTYKPTSTNIRDTSFALLRGGLKLYGGYPSGGGVRNTSANPTILSGDIGALNDSTDNSGHVLVIAGIASTADSLVIDGFTISKGNTAGQGSKMYNGIDVRGDGGGGISIISQDSIVNRIALRNCSFTANTGGYGGGMYLSSSIFIKDCLFKKNSGFSGCGIEIRNSLSRLSNCIFSENTGRIGIAVSVLNASPQFSNCSINDNGSASTDIVAVIYVYGASSPYFSHCDFLRNLTNLGSCYYDDGASTKFTDSWFDSNNGIFGGAISSRAFSASRCVFTNNYSLLGGAIYTQGSAMITDCIFWGNSCSQNGGAICISGGSMSINNCTLFGNSSNLVGGGIFSQSANPIITNSVIWNNSAPLSPGINGNATVSYSVIQDGYAGTGNSNTDPNFVNATDADGADNIFGTADDGLKLKPASPAINSGNNAAVPAGVTTDITGDARIQEGVVDMGAYEYNPCPASPIVYVDSAKATSGDGSSWANAYKTLTDALAIANRCTSVTQIWVAKGTYQPASGASFTMVPNVKIYGGFASGATLLSQRNFTANPTILKGNGSRVISNNNNSLSTSAVLDGFTITGGNATNGGGMYNFNNSSPTVTNCTFSANTAYTGGGMYNIDNSSPTVMDCIFSANTASYGGGMFNYDNSSPRVTNCTFSANKVGSDGGGMDNAINSSPTITNCIFSANTANTGGGMVNYDNSSPTVTNCTFSKNTASDNGGGMFNVFDASPTVTNCIFWGNTAFRGPAIFNSGGTRIVTYSIVQGGYSGTGNLDKDPLFVDTASGDLRLQPCSPAINRGLNSANNQPTDIAGNNRIQFAIIDLGAYESPYDTLPAPRVTINANPGSTICTGTPVTFTATAVNGGSAPAYQWKKNGTIVSTDSIYTTSTLSNRDTITVTLTNATSCSYPLSAADTLIVTVNPAPAKPTITANGSTTLCSGGSVQLTSSPASAYRWSNGASTQSITVMQSGAYTVTVTSASGCTSPTSDTTRVTASTLSAGNISVSPMYTVNPGGNANTIYLGYGPQSVTLSSGTVTGGTAPYTYQWSPATGLNNPLTASSVTAHPVVTTTYTLTIKDRNGCSINKTFTVNVIDARCGNKNDMVSVCHNGNTICVSQNAVQQHLNHGDNVGACVAGNRIAASSLLLAEPVVAAQAVSVYPNPSNGQFTVQLTNSKATKAEVQIVDAKGMVVESRQAQLVKGSQTVSFHLANKASGMYLVKVIDEKGIQTIKIMVQR